MKKLLYAINHRQTEDMISDYLAGEYLPVGAVTYKEAIIEQLHSTGADAVLIRDSLPGSTALSLSVPTDRKRTRSSRRWWVLPSTISSIPTVQP